MYLIEFFFFPVIGEIARHRVSIHDIIFFEVMDNYLCFHVSPDAQLMIDGRTPNNFYLVKYTMDDFPFEKFQCFERLHKSYAVHRDHIKDVRKRKGGRIELISSAADVLPVSDTYSPGWKQILLF